MKCLKNIVLSNDRLPGESEKDHIERVYNIFKRELEDLCNNHTYNGKKIVFPDYGVPNLERAFFNHIIHYQGEGKPLNYSRLVKCVLLPLILKNKCEFACSIIHKKPAKRKRISLYCEKYSYVILCEERKSSFYIVTGYCVSKKHVSNKFIN